MIRRWASRANGLIAAVALLAGSAGAAPSLGCQRHDGQRHVVRASADAAPSAHRHGAGAHELPAPGHSGEVTASSASDTGTHGSHDPCTCACTCAFHCLAVAPGAAVGADHAARVPHPSERLDRSIVWSAGPRVAFQPSPYILPLANAPPVG